MPRFSVVVMFRFCEEARYKYEKYNMRFPRLKPKPLPIRGGEDEEEGASEDYN